LSKFTGITPVGIIIPLILLAYRFIGIGISGYPIGKELPEVSNS